MSHDTCPLCETGTLQPFKADEKIIRGGVELNVEGMKFRRCDVCSEEVVHYEDAPHNDQLVAEAVTAFKPKLKGADLLYAAMESGFCVVKNPRDPNLLGETNRQRQYKVTRSEEPFSANREFEWYGRTTDEAIGNALAAFQMSVDSAPTEPRPAGSGHAWFPVTLLGDPMRQHEGVWETAKWPSESIKQPNGDAVHQWLNPSDHDCRIIALGVRALTCRLPQFSTKCLKLPVRTDVHDLEEEVNAVLDVLTGRQPTTMNAEHLLLSFLSVALNYREDIERRWAAEHGDNWRLIEYGIPEN